MGNPKRYVTRHRSKVLAAECPQTFEENLMLASLALSFILAGVSSHPQYVAMLPNGANVSGFPALGHVDPAGGGARNAFGAQFWAEWVNKFGWNATFCCLDADSDGQTNGMELGDPCESLSL